tara:strand:- start:38817 stop:39920 length:1104 start_codon:yes stop_codon:yes gene_type:complete
MESTENEPVLNVDELNSGQELTESAGDNLENNKEVVSENTNSDDDFKIEAFDPKAFSSREEEEEETEEKTEEEEEDNTLAWPDLESKEEKTEEEKTEEEKTEEEQIVNKESEDNNENNNSEVTQEQFKTFTNELGLEVENIDELKQVLNELVEENNKLKEGPVSVVSNKRLDDLNNFLKLEDELLVRKSFEADGLKEDKLDYAIDRLLDTGLIEVEALKIRNNIEKAVKAENQNIINKREQESAKQEESHTEAVESFGNYMQSVDTLFSFKITGNPDNLPEVRKNHTEYVTSGKYLKEITESEKTLAESSWLWRNRDVLKNALINNGRQNGRREILDKIGVPDKRKPQRFTNPTDTGDFDPAKFLSK